jgi:hypothetical protein
MGGRVAARWFVLALSAGLVTACAADEPPTKAERAAAACKQAGAAALSPCSKPTQTPAYYVDQAQRYFDALDTKAPADRVPVYAEQAARWEWPPWLKLTGFTGEQLESTDKVVKQYAPAVVSGRDCRAFAVQPFARCRVSFDYTSKTKGCPIYEEFTFNDAGQMTFVEAWSDLPGLTPITDPKDLWGERSDIGRLSTRIPGLGSSTGHLDFDSAAMQAAMAADPDVADFVKRAKDFWNWLSIESETQGEDYFDRGCGW